LRRRTVGRSRGRGRRKERGGERLTGGAGVSAVQGKRKRGRRGWAAAGGSWWAGRAAGPKGERDSFVFFVFFKLFSKQTFPFQFKPKFFKRFYKIFINFLEATQATKKPCKTK
jgi:hypothetical protein